MDPGNLPKLVRDKTWHLMTRLFAVIAFSRKHHAMSQQDKALYNLLMTPDMALALL